MDKLMRKLNALEDDFLRETHAAYLEEPSLQAREARVKLAADRMNKAVQEAIAEAQTSR